MLNAMAQFRTVLGLLGLALVLVQCRQAAAGSLADLLPASGCAWLDADTRSVVDGLAISSRPFASRSSDRAFTEALRRRWAMAGGAQIRSGEQGEWHWFAQFSGSRQRVVRWRDNGEGGVIGTVSSAAPARRPLPRPVPAFKLPRGVSVLTAARIAGGGSSVVEQFRLRSDTREALAAMRLRSAASIDGWECGAMVVVRQSTIQCQRGGSWLRLVPLAGDYATTTLLLLQSAPSEVRHDP